MGRELCLIANAGDGTISTLRLHRGRQPRLEVMATSGDLPGCSTFAIDEVDDLVHAAHKGEPAGIATLRLDRRTGELSELSRRPVESSMTYLSLTADRSALLGVSYGGGFGALWPVADAALGEPHSRFAHRNLHCIIHAGGYVYAVSLGEDLIAQFRLGEDGRLAPLDPPTVAAPRGSGPRHLIADGVNAYLVTEFSGELIRFRVSSAGTLSMAEARMVVDPAAGLSHSRFGADPSAERLIWGADAHRAGRFVVTSERSSSQLAATAADSAGNLGEVLGFTPTEQQPRGFAVSGDGAFLVVVGERSTHASLLQVAADGRLPVCDRVRIGRGANWVRFLSDA